MSSALRDTRGASPAPAARPDDPEGLDGLVSLIYHELRQIARQQLARERADHTLQTGELVHEAYLKLAHDGDVCRRGRPYFFGAASRAMRQVLVEHARRRGAAKRGGGVSALSLRDGVVGADAVAAELVDLDAALDRLAAMNHRQARVVECRFFGGLSIEETAEALDVSPRTVKYDWALARAWLYDALSRG